MRTRECALNGTPPRWMLLALHGFPFWFLAALADSPRVLGLRARARPTPFRGCVGLARTLQPENARGIRHRSPKPEREPSWIAIRILLGGHGKLHLWDSAWVWWPLQSAYPPGLKTIVVDVKTMPPDLKTLVLDVSGLENCSFGRQNYAPGFQNYSFGRENYASGPRNYSFGRLRASKLWFRTSKPCLRLPKL